MMMGMAGMISKVFLFGLNKVEVIGLPRFLEVLDRRRDPEKRQRGLITGVWLNAGHDFQHASELTNTLIVSNHLCV
jgi:hypothetical protein